MLETTTFFHLLQDSTKNATIFALPLMTQLDVTVTILLIRFFRLICFIYRSSDKNLGYDLFDKVAEHHQNEHALVTVDECYTCSYTDSNGIVNGNTACHQFDKNKVPRRVCPKYMNYACFVAAEWSDDKVNGEERKRLANIFDV